MKPVVPVVTMILLFLPAARPASAQDEDAPPPLVPPAERPSPEKEKEKEKPAEQPVGLEALDLTPAAEEAPATGDEAPGQDTTADKDEDATEPAGAQGDPIVLFDLTSDEANKDTIDLINAELHMVLDRSESHRLIAEESAGEDMMMSPAESLRFCNEEPGCIADLGKDLGAEWLVYGSVKDSFDQTLVLVHLVLVDVSGRKVAGEKFGQFAKSEDVNVVIETGNLLRDLVGIERPAPKKPVKQVAIKPPEVAPPVPPPPPAATVTTTAHTGRPGPWSNPWTWTAAGVGVASLTAGVVLGAMSRQKQQDAKAPGYDQPTAYAMVQDAEDMALGANVLFGLGGAALGTAVVLFILDATGDESGSASVACSQEGCTAVFSTAF